MNFIILFSDVRTFLVFQACKCFRTSLYFDHVSVGVQNMQIMEGRYAKANVNAKDLTDPNCLPNNIIHLWLISSSSIQLKLNKNNKPN